MTKINQNNFVCLTFYKKVRLIGVQTTNHIKVICTFVQYMEDKPLLRDPKVKPDEKLLRSVLGNESYALYSRVLFEIGSMGAEFQWNYYKDGKSWLCKVVMKKKTLFWLSVWDGYFKAGFYFTEKHVEPILALGIDTRLKECFATAKPIGKLIPLTLNVDSNAKIDDLIVVAQFKSSLK